MAITLRGAKAFGIFVLCVTVLDIEPQSNYRASDTTAVSSPIRVTAVSGAAYLASTMVVGASFCLAAMD
jgi:hypothetical protein